MQPPPKKSLDQVRDTMRRKHYAYRTEQSYVNWIKRYIIFHNKRHPRDMDHTKVEAFLTHLALTGVSASTQNQALSALLLLYREVLRKELSGSVQALRTRKAIRLLTALTVQEVRQVLACLSRRHLLMTQFLYGSGLRLMECVRLRVQDIDFGQHQILVRDGKGHKDRVTMLPETVDEPLRQNGVLTHEDLSRVLGVDARTIRRDVQQLKAEGHDIPTRGQVKGVGRGQTHKVRIIELWLDRLGYEMIARRMYHTPQSVKRYISTFLQMVVLYRQGLRVEEIAFLTQSSAVFVANFDSDHFFVG